MIRHLVQSHVVAVVKCFCVILVSSCGDLSEENSTASLGVTSGGSALTSPTPDHEPDATVSDASISQDARDTRDVQSYLFRIAERDAGALTAEDPAPQDASVERVWGLDAGLAVSADAGPLGGELAWLVTHIDDGAENAGPAGPSSVRALISRREAGVQALLPLFSGGDARRVPWARVVVQENLVRNCRAYGGGDEARRMVRWLETGSTTGAIDPRARWRWPWMRGPEFSWSPLAMGRLRTWVASGLSCDLRQIQQLTQFDAGRP